MDQPMGAPEAGKREKEKKEKGVKKEKRGKDKAGLHLPLHALGRPLFGVVVSCPSHLLGFSFLPISFSQLPVTCHYLP